MPGFANKSDLTGRVLAIVCGALIASLGLWVAFAADSVARTEMVNYVEVTSVEHLRLLREDMQGMREDLVEVQQRLAAMEALLRTP
jgi:hypothetical protein